MTVCIGALGSIAQNGKVDCVVLASDRMVTLSGFMEFEHQVPKVAEVSPLVYMMMAGDTMKASRILRHIQSAFANAVPSVEQVANTTGNAFHQMRLTAIDNDIMGPRGLNLVQFNQGQQQQLIPQLGFNLAETIASYDFGIELIVAGADSSGAHVLTVQNPGLRVNDHEQIGFAAIGSGGIHAMQAFIGMGHTKYKSLEETVFNAYSAKRRAEVAPGVGNDTDMLIVTTNGVKTLTQEELDELKTIYTEATKPVHDGIMQKVRDLKLTPVTGNQDEDAQGQFAEGN